MAALKLARGDQKTEKKGRVRPARGERAELGSGDEGRAEEKRTHRRKREEGLELRERIAGVDGSGLGIRKIILGQRKSRRTMTAGGSDTRSIQKNVSGRNKVTKKGKNIGIAFLEQSKHQF